ncbi:MAG: hypothetical protein ACYCTL_07750 [Acidimicrobiales bacterium]
MSDLRTTVTELVTGLGTLGYGSIREALEARPAEMVSVSPETWDILRRAHDGRAHDADFEQAWSNGVAFAHATDGLRGRRPVVIEWKGPHRAPGDEVAPIDLRIDHVYLISCKYRSNITINASPAYVFKRLLRGAQGIRGGDWYAEVAASEHQELYEAVVAEMGGRDFPRLAVDLDQAQRKRLSQELRAGWPGATRHLYEKLIEVVARKTAELWRAQLAHLNESEGMLWRILRMGSAPYFVLGTSASGLLRLRVATPWDWRVQFRLRRFGCEAQPGGQPKIGWAARVEDRHSGILYSVQGHVEVRWSHGRFSGNPEAKVYLDTPHGGVPGYFPLN